MNSDLKNRITDYQNQLEQEPNNQENLYQLALLWFQSQEFVQAHDSLKRLLIINPQNSEAHHLSALIYLSQNQTQLALTSLQKASKLNPLSPQILVNLGNVYGKLHNLDQAIKCFESALKINPTIFQAWFNSGNSWSAKNEPSRAKICYEKALHINPEDYRSYGNLGTILIEMGQLKPGFKSIEKALSLAPAEQQLSLKCGQLFTHLYNPQMSAHELWKETKIWGEKVEQNIKPLFTNHLNSPDPNRPLKIGYLSPAFCRHAAAFYADAYFKDWNPNLYTTYCYADVERPDDKTRELEQLADHFAITFHLSDQELAQKIYADQIDILIDPGVGHSKHNRMLFYALQSAPIQMTIYPTTIGLSRMNYRITDPLLDPPSQNHDFAEKLLYLPDNIFYYNPPTNAPQIDLTLPELRNGYITFGSFNNLPKLNSEVITCWARILRDLPTSKLILKTKLLKDLPIKQDLLQIFKDLGINPNRISLRAHSPTLTEHLDLYNSIDIALDPFPYNGHTTTLEALFMGTPVMALRGQNHFGRIASNLLHTLTIKECIAKQPQEYIEKTLKLASDKPFREYLNRNLRKKLLGSPLCQRKNFVHHLSDIYRQAWKTWCGTRKLSDD